MTDGRCPVPHDAPAPHDGPVPHDGPPPHRLDPTGADQYAVNDRLRARGAAVPVLLPGDVPAYAVTRHEELKDFLAHPDVAKNACHFAALQNGEIPPGWPMLTFATVQGMTTADGADHKRLRSLVTRAFTPRRVEAMRPAVAELTASLLDRLAEAAAAAPDGVVDLRRHFALPLPMSVICRLLGVDDVYQDRLHELSNEIVSTRTGPERVPEANREMVAILGQVAAARVKDPGDDLTSALIAARDVRDGEETGDRLSEGELIGTLLLMIIAGHETTLNLITNAVRALCGHRDQLELVRTGAATWGDVVEETLRYDSPVSNFPFRYPTTDLTVGDTVIPRGAPVLVSYASAGRDERAHGPDAGRFDVTRAAATRHLSFGHGAHYCLGAPLARMEAVIALEGLFTRFPGLGLAVPDDQLVPHAGFIGNSPQKLPVALR
jgi:cytochrome P450